MKSCETSAKLAVSLAAAIAAVQVFATDFFRNVENGDAATPVSLADALANGKWTARDDWDTDIGPRAGGEITPSDNIFLRGGTVTIGDGDDFAFNEFQMGYGWGRVTTNNVTGGTMAIATFCTLARYDNGWGVFNMSDGKWSCNELSIGAETTGSNGGLAEANLTGGEFSVAEQTFVSSGAGGTATMNIAGGTFTGGSIHVGRDGGNGTLVLDNAEFTINGGTGNWWGYVNLGWGYGRKDGKVVFPTGTMTVKSGDYSIPGYFCVGRCGYGILNVDGGSLTISGGALELGGDGTYDYNGETGIAGPRTGTINLNGGDITLNGQELQVAGKPGSNGSVYINSGTLKVTGAWFCVGHSGDADTAGSKAYLEVAGGAAVHEHDGTSWHNFTIGSIGTSACRSEVQVKSGSLSTDNIIYVGEINPAKMTVWGGTVKAGESICVQGSDSTLVVKGGTIETDHVYKGENGKLDIRGGTFKAIADEGNYFENCGDLTIAMDGFAFDTAGFDVTIVNNISGTGGIVKTGAGTLTLSGTVAVTGTIRVDEGTLVLNGQTYSAGTTVQTAPELATVVSATWTNAREDGDLSDPDNWICHDADGNVVENGVPGAEAAVAVPYGQLFGVSDETEDGYRAVHPGFDVFEAAGYASVGMSIAGTVSPRNSFTVPDFVKNAVAWYDYSDGTTVTLEDGSVTRVANKGSGGSSLDLIPFNNHQTEPEYAAETVNERNVMVLPNARGFVSISAPGLGSEDARTLVSVGRRDIFTRDDGGTESHLYSFGLTRSNGSTPGTFRISRWEWGQESRFYDSAASDPKDREISPGADPTDLAISTLAFDGEKTVTARLYSETAGEVSDTATLEGSLEADGTERIYAGTRCQYSGTSTGVLAEQFLFGKSLTDDEYAELKTYLIAKWFTAPEAAPDLFPGAISSIAFADGDAVLDAGASSLTLANVAGGGTIANAAIITIDGDIVLTANDDGTIDPLKIEGRLVLGEGARIVVKNGKKLKLNQHIVAVTATGGVYGEPADVTGDIKFKWATLANDVEILRIGGLSLHFR